MPLYSDYFGFEEVEEKMMKNIRRDDVSGFLPDESAYSTAMDAEIQEILSQLPINEEAFNADLAARGIYGAGEAPKHMYRNVYAPIARSMATVAAKSRLSFTQMQQRGRFEQERLKLDYMKTWYQKMLQMRQIKAQQEAADAALWGDMIEGGAAAGAERYFG